MSTQWNCLPAINAFFTYNSSKTDDVSMLNPPIKAQTLANSVDPDQTLQNVASDQGIQCFHEVQIFVCVEVLRPSQPNGVMSSAVSLPNHTFTGQT